MGGRFRRHVIGSRGASANPVHWPLEIAANGPCVPSAHGGGRAAGETGRRPHEHGQNHQGDSAARRGSTIRPQQVVSPFDNVFLFGLTGTPASDARTRAVFAVGRIIFICILTTPALSSPGHRPDCTLLTGDSTVGKRGGGDGRDNRALPFSRQLISLHWVSPVWACRGPRCHVEVEKRGVGTAQQSRECEEGSRHGRSWPTTRSRRVRRRPECCQ